MLKKIIGINFLILYTLAIQSGLEAPSLGESAAFALAQSLKDASATKLKQVYKNVPEDVHPELAQTLMRVYPELINILKKHYGISPHGLSPQLQSVYKKQHDFDGGATDYCQAAISNSGRFYAYATHAGPVNLTDRQTGESFYFNISTSPIDTLCFSADERYLALGTNKKAYVIAVQEQFSVAHFNCYHDVSALLFNPHDSNTLYIGSKDGNIRVGTVTTSKALQLSQLGHHHDSITGLAIHPTQAVLVSCSFNGIIKFWSLTTNKQLSSTQFPNHINAVSFDTKSKQLSIYSNNVYYHTFLWPSLALLHSNTLDIPTLKRSYYADYIIATDQTSIRLIHAPTNTTLTVCTNIQDRKNCAFNTLGTYAIVVSSTEQVEIFKFIMPEISLELAFLALSLYNDKAKNIKNIVEAPSI